MGHSSGDESRRVIVRLGVGARHGKGAARLPPSTCSERRSRWWPRLRPRLPRGPEIVFVPQINAPFAGETPRAYSHFFGDLRADPGAGSRRGGLARLSADQRRTTACVRGRSRSRPAARQPRDVGPQAAGAEGQADGIV